MTIIWIKWHDAVNSNATHSIASLGDLAELHEVGFLLAESAETITIGTESQAGQQVEARFWLTIPKKNIVEIRRSTLARAFPKPRPKKAKPATVPAPGQSSSSPVAASSLPSAQPDLPARP
jgi:hypothetical protein